jgi:2-haloacid dehalogenase
MKIKNIIFDFGGVLLDWNPKYLYQHHFDNATDMNYFLENICTQAWNEEQDCGRTLAEGTHLLQAQFPEFHDKIQLYYDQWETMLKSDIAGTVAILYQLKPKFKLYGLTNFSAETIGKAFKRYPFFQEFEGIVVSGTEKMIKPDKRFYQILFDRYNVNPTETIFIDDNLNNIIAGQELGLHCIHFTNPENLQTALDKILNE